MPVFILLSAQMRYSYKAQEFLFWFWQNMHNILKAGVLNMTHFFLEYLVTRDFQTLLLSSWSSICGESKCDIQQTGNHTLYLPWQH